MGIKHLLGFLASSSLIISCGGGSSSSSNDSGSNQVSVDFTVTDASLGFNLLAGETYAASITGCTSGFSRTDITDSNVSGLLVTEGDTGCEFRLTTMAIGGENFTSFPTAAGSWSQNSTFLVTGDQGTELYFKVTDQIADPISGTQSVSIIYAKSKAITDQTVGAATSAGVTIVAGDNVEMAVNALSVSVDGTNGNGLFDFTLECSENVAGTTCSGTEMTTMTAGMMTVTAPISNLTLDECKGIVDGTYTGSGATASTSNLSPTAYLPQGDAAAAAGGMTILDVAGPATLYGAGNSNLVMAIKAAGADEAGCTYFNVSITQP